MDSITVGLGIEGIGREREQPCFFPLSLPIHFSIFSFPFASSHPFVWRRRVFGGLKSSGLYLSCGHTATSRRNQKPEPSVLTSQVQILLGPVKGVWSGAPRTWLVSLPSHVQINCHMTQQSHFWAYTPRKPDLKETCAPHCSSQHCL